MIVAFTHLMKIDNARAGNTGIVVSTPSKQPRDLYGLRRNPLLIPEIKGLAQGERLKFSTQRTSFYVVDEF